MKKKIGIQCEFLLKDLKSQNICTFQFVIVYSKKKKLKPDFNPKLREKGYRIWTQFPCSSQFQVLRFISVLRFKSFIDLDRIEFHRFFKLWILCFYEYFANCFRDTISRSNERQAKVKYHFNQINGDDQF